MKHPNRDEWVPYVFGEARSDDAARLRAHLEGCAECATEVAAWQRSLQALNKWDVPEPVRHRALVAPVFRWAMAAAIVLAAGIALGRVTAPSQAAMRAEVERSVKAAVAQHVQQTLDQSEARLAAASQQDNAELWRVFSETLAAARKIIRRPLRYSRATSASKNCVT
jgi:Putative zinc-finger